MLVDDDAGMEMPAHRMHFDAPVNPFDDIWSRLSAVDIAFQGLQPQVQLAVVCNLECTLEMMHHPAFAMAGLCCSGGVVQQNLEMNKIGLKVALCHLCIVVPCLALAVAFCVCRDALPVFLPVHPLRNFDRIPTLEHKIAASILSMPMFMLCGSPLPGVFGARHRCSLQT